MYHTRPMVYVDDVTPLGPPPATRARAAHDDDDRRPTTDDRRRDGSTHDTVSHHSPIDGSTRSEGVKAYDDDDDDDGGVAIGVAGTECQGVETSVDARAGDDDGGDDENGCGVGEGHGSEGE